MGLRDEERRQLAEIERRLGEDDPRLAQRLATLRPGTSRMLWIGAGLVALFIVGGVVIALGAGAGAPVVVALGVIIAAGVPTAVIWRVWLRKLDTGGRDGQDDGSVQGGASGKRSAEGHGNGHGFGHGFGFGKRKGGAGGTGDGPDAGSGSTD
ncbi:MULTISPECIES: DUF3040 domain-containing protein [Prauserella salsuginis group]|uniref:DUF3040 domain-containing protein n=2 Tax=Prauserella salsuginis group TaxID=2893672 RepID=A0A839XWB3_9PSEU|nr:MULTISPECIES: DUF3040 domain-containing protein [Prauserella salsuginis group]MBB3664316.1 hypothetical protein [Prauserella sediminis]MCR3721767.1 Protein of unknown function (DUF3040) [Prauserella flava]MCR3734458.1 Protein of unknown function (DUF3040) [Prauserella salsuginis]